MNKRISLIAGLAGALGTLAGSTACAQSSVTVFGTIDTYAGSRQLSGSARNGVVNDGGLSTSHFGFRGTEDLGGGLKANVEISGFFGSDTGNSGRFAGDMMFSRRTAVGLAGGFGQVDFGRGSTPYFITMIRFNPFGDSSAFSPIFLHTYTGGQFPMLAPQLNAPDSGMSNMVQYTTPTIGGVRGSLQYGFGEVAGNTGKNRMSGSVVYSNGPLDMSLAFERNSTALGALATLPNPETKQLSWLASLNYNFGMAKLFAQVEQTTQEFTAANTDRKFKTSQLGASVPVTAAGRVVASWAHSKIDLPVAGVSPYTIVPGFATPPAGAATSGVDPKRDTVTLAYIHSMSKRTDLYALTMRDKYTGLASGTSYAVGMRHRF